MDKWAIALLAPLGTGLLLGMLALLAGLTRRPRLSWCAGMAATGWLLLWSIPAVSHWLQLQVEADFPPVAVQALPTAQALIVLGGAISSPTSYRPWPDLHDAADRVWHAARLYHAGKAPLLVLSGGAAHSPGAVPEAEAMRLFLRDLGVPDSALLLESRSGNTRENASLSAAMLKERGITRVLLVTSAMHMKRALLHFEEAGLQVTPAATDHLQLEHQGVLQFLPSAGALDSSGRSIKEWVGQLIWTRGRKLPATQ